MLNELTSFLVKSVVRDPDTVDVVDSERRGGAQSSHSRFKKTIEA